MNEVLRGAVAGLAGTAAMSAAMAVAKAAGLMPGESPPRKVSRNFEEAIGVRDELPPAVFEASWVGQHFAYGAAAGMAYALVRGRLRLPEPVPAGPLFGAALWAFGYSGWLPATGLYPPSNAEPRHRVGALIVAHLIYGTTTAAVSRVLDPGRGPLHHQEFAHSGSLTQSIVTREQGIEDRCRRGCLPSGRPHARRELARQLQCSADPADGERHDGQGHP